ncbi:hypothetical protein J7U46_12645 [Pelomonas sp. V22]|uniref:hypothetical protein n=1 Tax=Pelomonas sp. V22 TaxID=2822139 RepID=UPI0024A9F63D|nr:hypothetical protein [Pelomonas sp. V22]MDI4633898.1 hypothetical protein [Pelomonas sp. V22]
MSEPKNHTLRRFGASSIVPLLPALLVLAAFSAHADVKVQFAGGDDRWSQQVAAQMLPRSRDALSALESLALQQYGVKLDGRLNLLLQATPRAPLPAGAEAATPTRVEAGMAEAELRERALLLPLRQGMQSVVDGLTAGRAASLPGWLSWGLTESVARQIMADLKLPELPAYAAEPPINRPEGVDARRAAEVVQQLQLQRQQQRLSLAAVEALRRRLGEEFHPRMKAYLQAAAREGFDANASFEQQFGLKPAELSGLMAGAPAGQQGANPDRPLTVAQIDTSQDTPERQQAWAAFTKAAKPRALAISSDGSWGLGAQTQRPVDKAMDACKAQGGSNCRLLALDDEVVARPERAHVSVQMGGYVYDEFAQQVERDWLGLVRQASAQFDRLVNDVLKVSLVRDARIYVGGGVSDYEAILRDDMRMPAERAELQGEVSGGLSNSRGQIALKFTPRQNRAAAYDLAVKTTLHELTHELQKQLDNRHAGFSPPAWLREGTADLIAYLLAPQVRINDAEAEALRNWRERNLAWWRTGNKTNLQPAEMIDVEPSGWTRMMKEKRGNYQMAGLMSMYLQAINGERFLPAWVEYYRLAGKKGQSGRLAFEQCFGMTEAEFVADFKRWLAQQ